MHRLKINFFLLLSFLFLSSCTATKAVWDADYNETFRRFMINKGGNGAVFIGRRYDYVFNDNFGITTELLSSSVRGFLFINAEKSYLKVDRQNNIEGYVTIESFFNRLPNREAVTLHALGFRSENGGPLSLRLNLHGKRFLPSNNLYGYVPMLERTYIIPIHYDPNPIRIVGNVIVTPLTLLLDGVVNIGKVFLWPFTSN